MNYKALYPFDDETVEKIMASYDNNDPDLEPIRNMLLEYNEDRFCTSLLSASVDELLRTYPYLLNFFLKKIDEEDYTKEELGFEKYQQTIDEDDDSGLLVFRNFIIAIRILCFVLLAEEVHSRGF